MEVKVLIYSVYAYFRVHINLKSDMLLYLIWISDYCQSKLLPDKINVNLQQNVHIKVIACHHIYKKGNYDHWKGGRSFASCICMPKLLCIV